MFVSKNNFQRYDIGFDQQIILDPGTKKNEKETKTGINGYHGCFENFIGWVLKIFHKAISVKVDKKTYYFNCKSLENYLKRVNSKEFNNDTIKSHDNQWVQKALASLEKLPKINTKIEEKEKDAGSEKNIGKDQAAIPQNKPVKEDVEGKGIKKIEVKEDRKSAEDSEKIGMDEAALPQNKPVKDEKEQKNLWEEILIHGNGGPVPHYERGPIEAILRELYECDKLPQLTPKEIERIKNTLDVFIQLTKLDYDKKVEIYLLKDEDIYNAAEGREKENVLTVKISGCYFYTPTVKGNFNSYERRVLGFYNNFVKTSADSSVEDRKKFLLDVVGEMERAIENSKKLSSSSKTNDKGIKEVEVKEEKKDAGDNKKNTEKDQAASSLDKPVKDEKEQGIPLDEISIYGRGGRPLFPKDREPIETIFRELYECNKMPQLAPQQSERIKNTLNAFIKLTKHDNDCRMSVHLVKDYDIEDNYNPLKINKEDIITLKESGCYFSKLSHEFSSLYFYHDFIQKSEKGGAEERKKFLLYVVDEMNRAIKSDEKVKNFRQRYPVT